MFLSVVIFCYGTSWLTLWPSAKARAATHNCRPITPSFGGKADILQCVKPLDRPASSRLETVMRDDRECANIFYGAEGLPLRETAGDTNGYPEFAHLVRAAWRCLQHRHGDG